MERNDCKAGIQIHLKSPGCKLLYSGIARDLYITNFEISYVNRIADSLRANSLIWASEASLAGTRERAAKPRGPSLARSREARFACPNRRACSQAK